VLPPLPPETFVHDLKAMYATMSHADKYITINCTPSPACHLLVCRELTRGQPSKSASTAACWPPPATSSCPRTRTPMRRATPPPPAPLPRPVPASRRLASRLACFVRPVLFD
jgi:hypothetical protein